MLTDPLVLSENGTNYQFRRRADGTRAALLPNTAAPTVLTIRHTNVKGSVSKKTKNTRTSNVKLEMPVESIPGTIDTPVLNITAYNVNLDSPAVLQAIHRQLDLAIQLLTMNVKAERIAILNSED